MKPHRIEIYDGPDSRGRYHYALFWMADYHPGHPEGEYRHAERGQHFFGVPPPKPERGRTMQASPCKKCGEQIFLVHPDTGDCGLGARLVSLKAQAVLAVSSDRRVPHRLIVTGFYNDGGEWRPFGGVRARKNDRRKVVVHEEHECPKKGKA